MSVRVIRGSRAEPPEDDRISTSPEERIEAVWTLTKLCMAWNEHSAHEPRLQKTVTRLNAHNVEYLIVGAHALAAHGHVRATEDLDLWVSTGSKQR